jgi:hypothetical protein
VGNDTIVSAGDDGRLVVWRMDVKDLTRCISHSTFRLQDLVGASQLLKPNAMTVASTGEIIVADHLGVGRLYILKLD